MRPAMSSRSTCRDSSSTRRASSAVCTRSFAALIAWPAAGRAAAGSAPSNFSAAVSSPFLPSKRTRTASSPARSALDATSASARATRSAGSFTATPSRSGDAERRLGLLRNGAEGRRVGHGKLGQDLAVDRKACLAQAIDQAAIRQPIGTRRGIDAHDPDRAELALLGAPITISVLTGFDDCLFGRAIDLAAGVVIALRLT